MPELFDRAFQYFVSPAGSDERGDGTAGRPFQSLDRAAALIVDNHRKELPGIKPLGGGDEVEIVCIERPGFGSPLRKKPRFQYFVAPDEVALAGDGTEAAPWSDLETATAELLRMPAVRQIRPGDRIQLTRREVFSAGIIERRKVMVDRLVKIGLMIVTAALVLPLLAILADLFVKAWPILSWRFLVENPQNYMTAGGIWAPLVGTVYLVVISLAIAAPIGVLAGVYLNEYAGDNWLTRLVNLAVVNLAGVPSIVHALFGVGAFVLFAGLGRSVLAASATLAIMTLPVIITSTREALSAVPQSFREACWNMGASRWQTIRTIVLPNSISGILTGVILQVSRAAGETAPILFTGAVFYVAVPDTGLASIFPYSLTDRCMALSYHLFTISTQVTGVSEALQYGTAVVLFGLVLTVNLVSITLRVYLRSRKRW
ncbi:MAG TPA: phosphate ABC transporter permease PstA [Vicinamibacterales bacterium]|jgi:phosphate transport system permease protein